MSSPQLDSAIGALEAEISSLGTPQLKPGEPATALWFTLQAKSLGLSLLRSLRQYNITDPEMANRYRADLRKALVQPPEAPNG